MRMRKRSSGDGNQSSNNWQPEFDGIIYDEEGTRHVRAMVLGDGKPAVYSRKEQAGKPAIKQQAVRPRPVPQAASGENDSNVETLGIEGKVSLIDESIKLERAAKK
ncbi:MAG: hypothetical protein K6C95_01345 [Lachnospiraceae bacterium]|nr:hypothetical protein [Lachnospiraceae bacterium]